MSLDDFAALSLDDGPPSDTVTVITMGDIEDVAPSDLLLKCGTTVFEVHCAILAAASPVWRAMISGHASDDASILLPDDALAMHAALRIIYNEPVYPASELNAAVALAHKYELIFVTDVPAFNCLSSTCERPRIK
jgi:hypothetical protein